VNIQGFTTAQAVRHWLLTAYFWVQSWVTPCEFLGGQIGTGRGASMLLQLSTANHYSTISLHTHLSPSSEICDVSDQAAHYHFLDHLNWNFISDPALELIESNEVFDIINITKIKKYLNQDNQYSFYLYINTNRKKISW
jgi:hypothetical protein